MDAILYTLIYLTIGVAILTWEATQCEVCAEELRDHGWLLVALVATGWPVFVAMALADHLRGRD